MAERLQHYLDQLVDVPDPATNAPAATATAPEQAQTTNSLAFELAPMTAEQTAVMRRKYDDLARQRSQSRNNIAGKFIAEDLGAHPGVPLETNTGVDFFTRLKMATKQNVEGELDVLAEKFGQNSVRLNRYKQPVVRMKKDGKDVDVLANPLGMDLGDLATLAAQAPEMVGGVLGGKLLAKPTAGLWDHIMRLTGQTIGSQVAGVALKDVPFGGPPEQQDLTGLAKKRATQGLIEFGFGGALGMFGAAVGRIRSPFSNPATRQFNARAAQDYFQNEFPGTQRLPLTPAEATGSSFLTWSEGQMAKKPGSALAFERLNRDRMETFNEIQDIMLGGRGTVPTEEAIGQRAIGALGARVAPLEQGAQRAGAQAAGQAESEIMSRMPTGMQPVDKSALGQDLRRRAFAMREGFQQDAERAYDAVRTDPRVQAKNIEGDPLALGAMEMRDRLPTIATRRGNETLEEFVPDRVMPMIEALERGAGQRFRLDELMQMRREIDNQIAQGEAIPGYQTRYLTQMRGMLTDRIQTGLREIDPNLEQAWQQANDFYAEGVSRFKRAGISDLFRDPEQGSFVPDSVIVSRATSGKGSQDAYAAYRDFYGAGSRQVEMLQRSIADDVLGRSPLADTVDARGLVSRLETMASDNPTALREVFGMDAAAIRESAQVLRAARGENLPAEELIAAVNSRQLSAERLRDMLSAQATRDQAYRNDLVRQISKGNVDPDTLKPTDFVDKFAFQAEPAQVREAMGLLSHRPDVVEDIRRTTLMKILDRSTIRARNGIETIDSEGIEKMLADTSTAARLNAVLGPDSVEFLRRTRDLFLPGTVQQEAARSAGGLVAGQQVAKITEEGELKYIGRAVKNFVIASIYSSDTLRNWIANTKLDAKGRANLINYAIASEPFIAAIVKTYGDRHGTDVANQIKQSIDTFIAEQPEAAALPGGQPQQQRPLEEYLNQLQ